MKWRPPHKDDTRIRRGFLFLPKTMRRRNLSRTISDDFETRWLCFSVWLERYCVRKYPPSGWTPICWEKS